MNDIAQASRPMTPEEIEVNSKPWKELTVEQKLDRLAREVSIMYYMPSQMNSVQRVIEELKEHSHQTDGSIVIPFNKKNPYPSGGLVGSLNPSPKPWHYLQ